MFDYKKIFTADMNSSSLREKYFEMCQNIGRANSNELDIMKSVYYSVLDIVMEREEKEAWQGKMTSY